MRPLTDHCPKPLLPLAATPLVGYQLRRLAAVGVRQVVIATGYLAGLFSDTLGTGDRWGVRLSYSVEREPLGTGGALWAAVGQLPEVDQVIVVNGDLLSSHDLSQQLLATAAGAVSVHVRAVPDVAPYGQVTCDETGRVSAFAEKSGSGPGFANAGTYVVPAALLRALPTGRSSWERDLLPALIAAGERVLGWPGDGYFRDVGSPEAYRLACVDAVTGALPGGESFPGGSYVGASASVSPDARLSGGTSIHERAIVEMGAHLDGCVVLPGARVGAGARLERCVVASGAAISPGAICHDRVLTGILTHQ